MGNGREEEGGCGEASGVKGDVRRSCSQGR